MFKERLKFISDKFGGRDEVFYILNHKKHQRVILFRNNKESISFIKKKFRYSYLNKFIYFLIKIGALQSFLEKITLSSKLGDVIFIANTIRCFNLKDKRVLSFSISKYRDWLIVREINIRQRYLKDYSPEITKVDYKFPYFEEELLEEYTGDSNIMKQKIDKLNREEGFVHGDIIKDHILKKGNSCVFIDWENVHRSKR
jgi:hypothetical protein